MKQTMALMRKAFCMIGLGAWVWGVFASPAAGSTVCFVSALPRAEKTNLLYQGKKIRPFPFGEGDITACLNVPPGNLGFTVEDPVLGSKPLALRIDPGQHKTAVIYEKTVVDPKTKKEEKGVALLEVPSVGVGTVGQTRFRIAYVGGKEEVTLTVNGARTTMAPNSFSDVQEGGMSLQVQMPSSVERWSHSFEKARSFVLVVFPGHDGKLKITLAYEAGTTKEG